MSESVPDGAAVFPTIPEELGIDPLFLAVLHTAIFLSGSDEDIVHPEAAEETLHYVAVYVQRLEGERLRKIQEDLDCLLAYAKQEDWPKQQIRSLREFLQELGLPL